MIKYALADDSFFYEGPNCFVWVDNVDCRCIIILSSHILSYSQVLLNLE